MAVAGGDTVPLRYADNLVLVDYPDYTAAVKAGYTELSRLLEKRYGIDVLDAYQLLNLAGETLLGNEFSVSCMIRKSIFE